MNQVVPLQRVPRTAAREALPLDIAGVTDALAQRLAATAVERDRQGGHAAHEREWVRASGLLALTIPREHEGLGGDAPTLLRTVRRLAQADSALAHLFGFHHLQISTLLLYGNREQQRRHLRATAEQRLFWGNALNPADRRAQARQVDGGWQITGPKGFCSGARGSDWLTVSGWHETSASLLIGVAPTTREGITVHDDWDAFGQKQTDSGTVVFDELFIPDDDVLVVPGSTLTPQATLRSQVAQLIMANLYLGLAIGAFDEAREFTRTQSRAWAASGVERATDDPYIQHRYAELWLGVRAATALADAAAVRLDLALRQGLSLSAADRGEVAIAIAEAKVLSHRASLDVGSQLFELTGPRATAQRLGLDRYWRNARVHTLHDPVDYKLRDIGRWLLDGRVPEPTSYS